MAKQNMLTGRMNLGAVFKPNPDAGPGALSGQVEFTEDGQIISNELRLR